MSTPLYPLWTSVKFESRLGINLIKFSTIYLGTIYYYYVGLPNMDYQSSIYHLGRVGH
jgi:hypothetical protein